MEPASSRADDAPSVLADGALPADVGAGDGAIRTEPAPAREIVKKQGIRKRKRPDANGDSDDNDAEDEAARREKLALLRDLRADQKRAKARGLDPDALAQGDLVGQAEEAKRAAKVAAAVAAEEAIGQYGLKAAAAGGGKSEFGSGFTAETGIDSKDDPLLRAYIAQRLQEMQAAGGASAAAAAAAVGPEAVAAAAPAGGSSGSAGGNDELKRLYEMPDELRVSCCAVLANCCCRTSKPALLARVDAASVVFLAHRFACLRHFVFLRAHVCLLLAPPPSVHRLSPLLSLSGCPSSRFPRPSSLVPLLCHCSRLSARSAGTRTWARAACCWRARASQR